jgi:hypothetical protein
MVALLVLAHDRGCEAELAVALTDQMQRDRLPDLSVLRSRFAPAPATVPDISVELPPIASYDALLPATGATA